MKHTIILALLIFAIFAGPAFADVDLNAGGGIYIRLVSAEWHFGTDIEDTSLNFDTYAIYKYDLDGSPTETQLVHGTGVLDVDEIALVLAEAGQQAKLDKVAELIMTQPEFDAGLLNTRADFVDYANTVNTWLQ